MSAPSGRFPGFDAASQAPHWDQVTAELITARSGPPPEVKFFNDAERPCAAALLDLLTGQDEDDAFAVDIRGYATDANNFGEILGRNRGALGNLVYRPRSDLLLSAEFRRLHTFPIYDSASVTNQINLAVGVLF